MGLPVREDQLAVAIHQVDELVDVVPEHRREEGVAELLHQLLRGDFPDGWNTLQCLEHGRGLVAGGQASGTDQRRSEEHTSELQSLMRISYAVFCLQKKNQHHCHTLYNS